MHVIFPLTASDQWSLCMYC